MPKTASKPVTAKAAPAASKAGNKAKKLTPLEQLFKATEGVDYSKLTPWPIVG